MSDNKTTHILCEQGDMGLWDTPVTHEEQKLLNENSNETKKDNKNTK